MSARVYLAHARDWLHRLHCVAMAMRGANSFVTTTGETLAVGHCKHCNRSRVVDVISDRSNGLFREGDVMHLRV